MGRDESAWPPRLVYRISIHSPRMGRDYIDENGFETVDISIHSPRMGRDILRRYLRGQRWISIHSPRMGRDRRPSSTGTRPGNFNPLSPHGERPYKPQYMEAINHFNPLSPHGERPVHWTIERVKLYISIHSPRMGRDNDYASGAKFWTIFQSTLPAWGETFKACEAAPQHRYLFLTFQSTLPAWGETPCSRRPARRGSISIHSPRMGRDSRARPRSWPMRYFNPLSPHGERRGHCGEVPRVFYFNPLSPHGERPFPSDQFNAADNFNPLSPHGERPIRNTGEQWRNSFQSTLPAWGETTPLTVISSSPTFQSTLPAWGETIFGAVTGIQRPFQSTLPAWGETDRAHLQGDGH